MKSIQPPTASDHQINRLQIARILKSEDFLAGIKVNIDGRFRALSISWDGFWAPLSPRIAPGVLNQLAALQSSRRAYIGSNFSLRLARPYYHAYFSLLHSVLDCPLDQPIYGRFLRAVLGFECAAARWPDQSAASFAVTSNIRNPVYLLAKIREPLAYEDPKFLPLITVFDPLQQQGEKAKCFYHYRQMIIDKERGFFLLVYPSVELANRLDSFACIHNLCSGLTHRKDPRSRRRSSLIADYSIGPFFRNHSTSKGFGRTGEIKIADLGGGSSSVLRGVCERLLEKHSNLTARQRFSWTVVDVKFQSPRRHARNRRFRQHLSSLRWVQADYLSWINQQHTLPKQKQFHVILLCRLLNNLSNFSIGWIDDWPQVQKLTLGKLSYQEWQQACYRPKICLEQDDGNPRRLITSNARVKLLRGSSFCQASATDYFRGLYQIQHASFPVDASNHAIFFPIRRFNALALQLPDGNSIFNKLASLGQLIVIEDVDCRANDLRKHLEDHGLDHLAASDATDRNRMRSSRLLCICSKDLEDGLPGTRIW